MSKPAINKAALIDHIRDRCDGVQRKTVSDVVDALFDAVQDAVSGGGEVTIAGFGKFTSSHRAARTGRNPRTGAALRIAATTVPTFKPGKAFKDAVNR